MDNANSKEYLEKIHKQVLENLRNVAFAPSVQLTDVPRDSLVPGLDDETEAIMDDLDDDENKDTRMTQHRHDKAIEHEGELSESEDESATSELGVHRQPNDPPRARNQINHRDINPGPPVARVAESTFTTPSHAPESVADEEMVDVSQKSSEEGMDQAS